MNYYYQYLKYIFTNILFFIQCRILKKKLQQDGFLNELREREYYTSKGEKKRHAKAAAIRRAKKERKKRLDELGY